MTRLLTFLAAAVPVAMFGQPLTLSTGESYVFEFTSVSYVRPATATDGARVEVSWNSDWLDAGESLFLELFPDSLSDTPESLTISGLSEPPPVLGTMPRAIAFIFNPDSPMLWPDLQGVIRVTMNNGSIDLAGFGVAQIVDGDYYSQTFTVPEPSVAAFALVGAWVFVLLRRLCLATPNQHVVRTRHPEGSEDVGLFDESQAVRSLGCQRVAHGLRSAWALKL